MNQCKTLNNEEEDVDQIKDEQNPRFQKIQIDRLRIIKILDDSIDKVAIAYTLSDLLGDSGKLIKYYMPQQKIKELCEAYIKVKNYSASGCPSNLSDIMPKFSMRSKRNFKDKSHKTIGIISEDGLFLVRDLYNIIISQLAHYKGIINISKNIMAARTLKSVKPYVIMKDVRNFVYRRLYCTATEEKLYKLKIGYAYKNNEVYKKQVNDMQTLVDEGRKHHRNTLNEIQQKILAEERRRNELNEEFIDEAKKMVMDSEDVMLATNKTSNIIQHHYTVRLNRTLTSYQNYLETNLNTEKIARQKEKKVRAQLAGVIAQFDMEMGDLIIIYDDIFERYENEKEAYESLLEKFNEQTIEYDILMEEKEIEDERLWQIRYYEFMKQRSARKIQRWWRNICERKRRRRRKKKNKNAKKR